MSNVGHDNEPLQLFRFEVMSLTRNELINAYKIMENIEMPLVKGKKASSKKGKKK